MPILLIDPPGPYAPPDEWDRFERGFLAAIEAMPEGERAVAREQLRRSMALRLVRPSRDGDAELIDGEEILRRLRRDLGLIQPDRDPGDADA